ncbi:MAG TPA: hypothetical protein VM531_10865 [Sphingomicrobium sp.]|nr:hypothetical protein [Sphingomicrobium sp.]
MLAIPPAHLLADPSDMESRNSDGQLVSEIVSEFLSASHATASLDALLEEGPSSTAFSAPAFGKPAVLPEMPVGQISPLASNDAVQSTVTSMVAALNRADISTARRLFADGAIIVEDIAPYRWEGENGVDEWLTAVTRSVAYVPSRRVNVRLGEAVRTEIAGDKAYAVFAGALELGGADGDVCADGLLTATLAAGPSGWIIDMLVWGGTNPRLSGRVSDR